MFSILLKHGGTRTLTSGSTDFSVMLSRKITSATRLEQLSAREKYEAAKPYNEIPGPKSYPFIKSAIFLTKKFSKEPKDMVNNFILLKELYGPVVRFDFPLRPRTVIAYDPTTIEEAIREGVTNKPTRDGLRTLHVYRTQTRKEWFQGSAGLLTEQNENWYRIRSKVQQPMMRPKTAVQYLTAMNEVAQDFIQHIRRIRGKDNNQVHDNFINELYKWGLESVGLVAFNTRIGCLSPDLTEDSDGQVLITSVNKAFEALMALEMALPFWVYFPTKDWKKMVEAMDKMSLIGFKYINKTAEDLEKKLTEEEEPELSVLEKFLTMPGLKKSDAYNMAMDMLFAGIDTTGNAMSYFLYLVAKHPEVQRNLHQEIDRILPTKETPLSSNDINQLSYLKATIKETMRLFPITSAWGRTLDQDIVIDGYQVPKGANVMFLPHLLGQDAKYFPDPEVFKPERWLRGGEEQQTAHPMAFLPFGYGVRMCVGRRIAEQELWVLSTKILRNFWVNYNGKDMETVTRLVNAPAVPLRFQFVDRS